ncbi:MAG: molybdopterin molybdotransferase MoeA [Deltaproteobacteria bacterium]|nr:molybdopterin molybdotransferase MoeA [Deltaproteobacteria bacterium]
MITVSEALHTILRAVSSVGIERVNILSALGRVLAEDIYARRTIPPTDNSAMDGYALIAEDTMGATAEHPLLFDIIEDVPAGNMPQKIVGFAEATRIMTGAPTPEGVDAVVPVEDTELDGDRVKIFAEASMGQNIRSMGEDVKEGEVVIPRGAIIRPAETGMLAALGRSFVAVYQKPLVAILATGDELVDIDGELSPEKIISSNSYSGAAQVIECGGIPLQIGIAKDTKEDLTEKFKAAMRADIIMSSAGVSVGDYDFVKDVMKEIGVMIDFHQVAQRPGKPFTFGTAGKKLVFGLPGNPVSSMITFEQYVRPTLLKMTGHKRIFRTTIKAILQEDIQKKKGLRYFLRVQVRYENGRFTAVTTGEQGSGILKSMVLANGIMVLPEDITSIKKGSEVMVQVIDTSFDLTEEPGYL